MLFGVHRTKNFNRYRQVEPSHFIKDSFRTKKVSESTELIVGHLKEKYAKKGQRGMMVVQSILKRR